MYEDLATRIGKALGISKPATISGPDWNGKVEMEWETWNEGANFAQLMEIATILGTMRFDVKFRRTDGYAISEVTWEDGQDYIAIRFAEKDLGDDLR